MKRSGPHNGTRRVVDACSQLFPSHKAYHFQLTRDARKVTFHVKVGVGHVVTPQLSDPSVAEVKAFES